ncbi:MAG: hypothetical protein GY861_15030 [bacterium]|nr:hypothetical protein [bacterium]
MIKLNKNDVKLENCAHCGSGARVVIVGHTVWPEYYIVCDECGIRSSIHNDIDLLIDRWNNRVKTT